MPTSAAPKIVYPKEEPEPFTIKHFPNEKNNSTVPRLGRFAMPAASLLTLFYANPAFARIIANSQAGTAFEKDALGVGIVTYTATYWWDPSLLISSLMKFVNFYFQQLEAALQTQVDVVANMHELMPLGAAILLYGAALNGVLFPGQVVMQKRAMEIRYKQNSEVSKYEYEFFQTKVLGRTAMDWCAFFPLWIIGCYAIVSQNVLGTADSALLGGGIFEPWLWYPSVAAPQYEDVMGFGWIFDDGFDINKAINHFDLGGYSKLRYFFLPTILATRFQTKKIPGDRLFKINFSPDLFLFSLFLPVGVQEFWLTQTFIDREQRKVARTLALEWLRNDVI